MSAFRQYLKLSRKWFDIQRSKKFGGLPHVNIVIGNESADLDSTIGSMIYSYYKFCKADKGHLNLLKTNVNIEQKEVEHQQNVYLPIVQCDRSDITSRFDSLDLLESHQIDINDIIFKDDFNLEEIISATKLNVVLYDHNCTTYPILKERVVEILDHHKDTTADFYPKDQQISKNIATIGSATTLLAEYFMNGDEELLDSVVADSILKTIIVDSYNFDPKQETVRWNQRDQAAFQYLLGYLNKQNSDKPYERNEIFKKIEGLKFDYQKNINLGITKLLIKDYKQFYYQNNTVVGYSVFMIPPESLLQAYPTEQFEQDIQNFFTSKKLDILILLFAYPTKEHFERKFIVLSYENRLADLKVIKETFESNLKVAQLDLSNHWKIFKQSHFSHLDTSNTYTRKIIEPLVSQIPFSKL